MQQKEGSSWVSWQALSTSEESTLLQFRYAQQDNEPLEYDNQETQFDSDANTCQKMNSLESDDDRNMSMALSKGSLIEKKEALLLGREDSSYYSTPDGMYTMRKLLSILFFMCIALLLVVGLLYSMYQPPIVHPHNYKNATQSGESSKDMKGSADKTTDDTTMDGGMTHFCLPNQELSSQCPHEEMSIQQCVAKEIDNTFWTPFKVADESMCSVEGGVHYGPEAPFRDPAPGYDIPRYKERTHSSFFRSIHALPMEKISLSVPKLKRKRKKKSQSRSKQHASSEPVPGKDSHGTRVIVVLFQLLLLQCTVLPISIPLQEHLLLGHEATPTQTGLANYMYATFTDYQDIETLTFSHVVITVIILRLNSFRQSIVTGKLFRKLKEWMKNQLAKFAATQSSDAKLQQSKPLPADLQPQSQINDQSICIYQQQAKDQAEKHLQTASGTNEHQVTDISSQVTCTGGFVNSAEYLLEDASQIEIANDFSEHINHTSSSAADNNAGSLPYREHTERVEPSMVEPPSLYDSVSLPHGSFGMERENPQYATTSPSIGIHLEAEPCEPIACSDSSNGGHLVCPTFYRRRGGNVFQNEEFFCSSQGGALLNDLNSATPHDHDVDELTTIMPQEVTIAIPTDSPSKLYIFSTAVNYDLIKLRCVRMANDEGLLPPERHPINIDCSMPLHESLGHN